MIGTMRTSKQVRLLAQSIGQITGTKPNDWIVSYYGYPTCPRLPLGDPSGTNRLPHNIRLDWAGHPAYWLPYSSRLRQTTENDQQYNIRVYLELLTRGYYADAEAENGQFVLYNMFELENINIKTSSVRNRLQNYITGASDTYFNSMVLVESDLIDLNHQTWLKTESEIQYLKAELSWHYRFAVDDDQYFDILTKTIRIFQQLDIVSLMSTWDQLASQWANNTHTTGYRDRAVELIGVYKQGLDHLYQHLLSLELSSQPIMPPEQIQQIQIVYEADTIKRHATIDAAVQQLYLTGSLYTTNIRDMLYAWLYEIYMKSTALVQNQSTTRWIDQRRYVRFNLIQELEQKLQMLGYTAQVTTEVEAS